MATIERWLEVKKGKINRDDICVEPDLWGKIPHDEYGLWMLYEEHQEFHQEWYPILAGWSGIRFFCVFVNINRHSPKHGELWRMTAFMGTGPESNQFTKENEYLQDYKHDCKKGCVSRDKKFTDELAATSLAGKILKDRDSESDSSSDDDSDDDDDDSDDSDDSDKSKKSSKDSDSDAKSKSSSSTKVTKKKAVKKPAAKKQLASSSAKKSSVEKPAAKTKASKSAKSSPKKTVEKKPVVKKTVAKAKKTPVKKPIAAKTKAKK